ncbi:NAD(P)-binding protein [Nocardioides halotolerans]|uniref:NAD(P)-binding protein n=1 Tax=Nocardioides halotolerans TaxID=433660 RepID=UPI00041FD57B|nr:NAD(P)-binding protein [Nocardioides halotolerans]
MSTTVDVEYLVVGAGATGMAFVDALVDHAPDVRVAMVDRRHGVGGHWLEVYPFVQLHQASQFYGVASTVLGGGRVQERGPEAGLHERAGQAKILAYYADVLADRLLASGRVELFTACDHVGGRTFVSRVSGERYDVPERCRVVDARYLAPDIPAEQPPPFGVEAGARVVPVNDLVHLEGAASQYVVVGSGKTATDAIVWLLGHGVDPDAVCWVRPREPWMLNRALVQPDPVVFLGMAATMLERAAEADSLDGLLLALEDEGIMMRVDRSVVPTMAKAPTLATWELDLLRSIEHVVRLGHVRSVAPTRLVLDDGETALAPDALVVNCAGDGLKRPPLVPIWGRDAITLQPVRAGFPCFGAAMTGYVEATRKAHDDDAKNAVCRPSPYGNSLRDWAAMNVVGMRNAASFAAEPDVREWAQGVALNPARVSPEHAARPELGAVQERMGAHSARGLDKLAALMV